MKRAENHDGDEKVEGGNLPARAHDCCGGKHHHCRHPDLGLNVFKIVPAGRNVGEQERARKKCRPVRMPIGQQHLHQG